MKSITPEGFFLAPYSDRQLVVFVDDSTFEFKTDDSSSHSTINVISNWAQAGLSGLLPLLAVTETAKLLIDIYNKLQSKNVTLSYVPKSWHSHFNLPPGHPRSRLVYIGHPASPSTYVPLADFHRFTFEHKFSEMLSLLMHLGASEMRVYHVQGWDRQFSNKLGVGIPQAAVSLESEVKQNNSSSLLYEANLPGHNTPQLPENLVWYNHESTWQKVAEGRLKFGMKDFSLNLQYQEDYGVNASLKKQIQAVGLELGGAFEQHRATTWEIRGTFNS